MRKNLNIVLVASVCIFVSVFLASLYAAEIIYVEGSVQVQNGQGDSWMKAERGTKVSVGDKIRTARNSIAEVSLDDEKKNTIRINPKTLVVLNSLNPGLIDKLDLSRGKVYAKVENIKSGLSFEIATPSSVAGVRGSAFSVLAERDEDEIQALKDSAFVQAYDRDGKLITELTLPEGFKTFVERFETPSSLIQVSLREFTRFDRLADEISAHEQGNMEKRQERQKQEQGSDKINQPGKDSKTIEELNEIKEQEKENALDKVIDTTRESHEESGWVW
jgi:hypothetical protein